MTQFGNQCWGMDNSSVDWLRKMVHILLPAAMLFLGLESGGSVHWSLPFPMLKVNE
jgi:hypothetical protein